MPLLRRRDILLCVSARLCARVSVYNINAVKLHVCVCCLDQTLAGLAEVCHATPVAMAETVKPFALYDQTYSSRITRFVFVIVFEIFVDLFKFVLIFS